jgi:hypothetical protein
MVMTGKQRNDRDEKYNQALPKFVVPVVRGFAIRIGGSRNRKVGWLQL